MFQHIITGLKIIKGTCKAINMADKAIKASDKHLGTNIEEKVEDLSYRISENIENKYNKLKNKF